MNPDRRRLAILYSLAAGTLDGVTGLLLVAAPGPTLALFGAALPGAPGDDILMRFVGAFVAGVGFAYLWAAATPDPAAQERRLPGMWGATAVVRAGIAAFTLAAVVWGRLEPAWLVVGGTDAILAATQAWALRAGWLR